jgi:hypothetical protein
MLPQVALPKYECVLPCSKVKLNYRPFMVKEEKLILLAMQENDNKKISSAIKAVLESCTFGVKFDNIPQIDIEYLFLQIRNKSMGEGVDVVSTCVHCDKVNNMMLDLSKVEVVFPSKQIPDVIQVSENLWVKMRLPNIDEAYKLNDITPEQVTEIMASCIVSIIEGEKVIDAKNHKQTDLVNWIESLSEINFNKIIEFMSNVPIMKFEQEYFCVHCREKNLILLEGMESFFD